MKRTLNRNILLLIICFFLSVFIFQFNFLKIGGSYNFFNLPSINAEIEATDGILYGKKTGRYVLGKFQREDPESFKFYKENFKDNDSNWDFKEYKTSFGLSSKIFGYLNKNYNLSLNQMNFINSIIFSIIIILYIFGLSKHFSFRSSYFFGLSLTLSPWVIAFSRDIRYVEWTWYLPLCLTIIIENYIKDSIFKYIFLSIVLFFSIFFNCLIGFEYITCIAIMPIVYIFFSNMCQNNSISKTFFKCIFLSFIITSSIIFSLLTTINKNLNLNDNYYESVNILSGRILYNFNLIEKDKYIRDYCKDEGCIEHVNNFSQVSRLEVLARYFIFRNMLPFVGNLENIMTKEFKSDLFKIAYFRDYNLLFQLHKKHKLINFVPLLSTAFQSLLFVTLLAYAIFISIFRYEKTSILFIGSLISSLSWYILASTHSLNHIHLNFIVWYLYLIPFLILYLLSKKKS